MILDDTKDWVDKYGDMTVDGMKIMTNLDAPSMVIEVEIWDLQKTTANSVVPPAMPRIL